MPRAILEGTEEGAAWCVFTFIVMDMLSRTGMTMLAVAELLAT